MTRKNAVYVPDYFLAHAKEWHGKRQEEILLIEKNVERRYGYENWIQTGLWL